MSLTLANTFYLNSNSDLYPERSTLIYVGGAGEPAFLPSVQLADVGAVDWRTVMPRW